VLVLVVAVGVGPGGFVVVQTMAKTDPTAQPRAATTGGRPTSTPSPKPTPYSGALSTLLLQAPQHSRPMTGKFSKTADVTLEEASQLYAFPAGELSAWNEGGVRRIAINAWQHLGGFVIIEIRQFRSSVAAKKYMAEWSPYDVQYRGTFAGSEDARWFDETDKNGKIRTTWLAAKGDLFMLHHHSAVDGVDGAKVLAELQFSKLP
jgi:hypothetical protein